MAPIDQNSPPRILGKRTQLCGSLDHKKGQGRFFIQRTTSISIDLRYYFSVEAYNTSKRVKFKTITLNDDENR